MNSIFPMGPALALTLLLVTVVPSAAQPTGAPLRPRAVLPEPERAEPIAGLRFTIVAIDAARGIVTAADHAGGYRARIEVRNRLSLRGLRVGQQVATHRASTTVSLANRQVLGRLTVLATGGPASAEPPPPPPDVVAACREESAKQTGAAVMCVPHATLVGTGSSPGPEDDTYSWTCICH